MLILSAKKSHPSKLFFRILMSVIKISGRLGNKSGLVFGSFLTKVYRAFQAAREHQSTSRPLTLASFAIPNTQRLTAQLHPQINK
jgi:hypothetical protein